jgi:hypothetical protein
MKRWTCHNSNKMKNLMYLFFLFTFLTCFNDIHCQVITFEVKYCSIDDSLLIIHGTLKNNGTKNLSVRIPNNMNSILSTTSFVIQHDTLLYKCKTINGFLTTYSDNSGNINVSINCCTYRIKINRFSSYPIILQFHGVKNIPKCISFPIEIVDTIKFLCCCLN